MCALTQIPFNDFDQKNNQMRWHVNPPPRRDTQSRKNGQYNTFYLKDDCPVGSVYYIDADTLSSYDPHSRVLCGTKDNTINIWYTLPHTLTPAERLIMEAVRTYSNLMANNTTSTEWNNWFYNNADCLCNLLQKSASIENKNNLSTVIRNNVVIPSMLQSNSRMIRDNATLVSIGTFCTMTYKLFTLSPLISTFLSLTGSGLLAACPSILLWKILYNKSGGYWAGSNKKMYLFNKNYKI